jgi:Na+/proline symporter
LESNVVVIISFAIYSLFIIGTGIYTTKLRKKTDADFVLANRELGSWSASLSASASSESGWVMLGLVGMAFSTGLSTAWVIPGIGAGYLFNWFVIAERLRKATSQMGALTLPQYISARFDPNSKMLRLIAVVIITTAMLGYVAAQMNSAGGALIVLAYTITGGFRAICWTDIIQASFMVVALVGMPFVVLSNLESFGGAMDTLRAADPSLLTFTGSNVGFAMFGFVIGLIGIGFGYPGQPQILARFMAARDKDTVTKFR